MKSPPLDKERSRQLLAAGELESLAAYADHLEAGTASALADEVQEHIALACAMLGRNDDAERIFSAVLQRAPDNLMAGTNLGVLYLRSCRYVEAQVLLAECLRRAPGNGLLLFNLGLTEFALGNIAAATSRLRDYLVIAPEDDIARLYLARCHVEVGDHDAAEALVEGRSFDAIDTATECQELSQLYLALGESMKAEAVQWRMLQRSPEDADARIGLAQILERASRFDDAQGLIDALPKALQDRGDVLLLKGKLQAHAGRLAEALQNFDTAMEYVKPETDALRSLRFRGEVAFERGRMLDRLGRYVEAYTAFADGNLALRNFHDARTGRIDGDGFQLTSLVDDPVVDEAVATALRETTTPVEAPIFIVGFPRSGTTLLDQMLDAHPGLQVMEEKPALEAVVAEFRNAPNGYPRTLLDLSAADREYLRSVYWRRVGRYLQRRPGTCLVDKSPLLFMHLQLALCLFPKAKWIFAVRHPCDVVLSCFMQPLRHTPTTHGFYSIDQTASVYAQIMGTWFEQRARLRPDCFEIRYEDLVSDFAERARQLIAFLGLPWDDTVLRYHEHARTRRINTPSYAQVVQPIYRTAAGRWRNYRRWFGNAEAQLSPFISAFGYPPVDDASGNSAESSGTNGA